MAKRKHGDEDEEEEEAEPGLDSEVDTTLTLGRSGNLSINREPKVKIMSLTIQSPDDDDGSDDIILPIPESGKPQGTWFTLKEGTTCKFQFDFRVSNNILRHLRYVNTVWKLGRMVIVGRSNLVLGTFSPSTEPYSPYAMAEHYSTYTLSFQEALPGASSSGAYFVITKFLDENNKCYMELHYTFVISKD